MARTIKQVEGFCYTTAIGKLRRMTKRIRGIPGGTSAGKTYGILPILIDRAARVGFRPKIGLIPPCDYYWRVVHPDNALDANPPAAESL
jgi:hypothetical protein